MNACDKMVNHVLLHGFAYGTQWKALKEKKVIVAFTTGAPLDAYQYVGWENFDISAFLPQFIQLTNLCSMEWAGYVVSFGYSFVANNETK